jgi:hypothetical protein
LAVLNGEEDAHKVLADMLEESGERGLAQWARKSKGGLRKRLDFVLAVVPYTTAVLFACDYVEHLHVARNQRRRDIVGLVRAALQNEHVSTPWLKESRGIADRSGWWQSDARNLRGVYFGHDCLTNLIDAGQQALLAAWNHQQGNGKESRTMAEKAQAKARRTAKATLYLEPKELAWQIEHTKQVLEKPWPK